jgi:hypothetical protein
LRPPPATARRGEAVAAALVAADSNAPALVGGGAPASGNARPPRHNGPEHQRGSTAPARWSFVGRRVEIRVRQEHVTAVCWKPVSWHVGTGFVRGRAEFTDPAHQTKLGRQRRRQRHEVHVEVRPMPRYKAVIQASPRLPPSSRTYSARLKRQRPLGHVLADRPAKTGGATRTSPRRCSAPSSPRVTATWRRTDQDHPHPAPARARPWRRSDRCKTPRSLV